MQRARFLFIWLKTFLSMLTWIAAVFGLLYGLGWLLVIMQSYHISSYWLAVPAMLGIVSAFSFVIAKMYHKDEQLKQELIAERLKREN